MTALDVEPLDNDSVSGHLRDHSAALRAVPAVNATAAWAAGAVVAPGRDVAAFLRALVRGQIIPRPLVSEMRRTRGVVGDPFIARYGLGIYAMRTRCGFVWGHEGELFGFYAAAFVTGDGGSALVMMTNANIGPGWTRATVSAALCRGRR